MKRNCIFASLFLIAVPLPAFGYNWSYPVVPHGPVVAIPDATAKPDPGLRYKVLFSITEGVDDRSKVNGGLSHVARFVNLLPSGNVDPKKTDIIAVVHGSATPLTLKSEAYQAAFGRDNPNLELVRKLRELGVKFQVCGQAVAGLGAPLDAVAPEFELALSAMTVMANKQLQGYALMPY